MPINSVKEALLVLSDYYYDLYCTPTVKHKIQNEKLQQEYEEAIEFLYDLEMKHDLLFNHFILRRHLSEGPCWACKRNIYCDKTFVSQCEDFESCKGDETHE